MFSTWTSLRYTWSVTQRSTPLFPTTPRSLRCPGHQRSAFTLSHCSWGRVCTGNISSPSSQTQRSSSSRSCGIHAWDESFESLHNHISSLVRRAHAWLKLLLKYIQVPDILKSPAEHSCYLQALQGRLLHYESLLDGYQAAVSFIENTPNPAVESLGTYEAQRKASNELMKKECENLLSEIGRLEKRRRTMKDRVKNLLDIVDSNQTKALIEVMDKGSDTLTKVPSFPLPILASDTDTLLFLFRDYVPDDDIPTGDLNSRKQRFSVFAWNHSI